MSATRIAAVLTWFYAAGFGLSTIPVAIYLQQRGALPSFFGLFDMYGGPWSSRVSNAMFIALLLLFLALLVVVAGAAWLVWDGSRIGAVLLLALLPVEAVFWFGFALPIPWALGVARVGFLVAGWRSLS